MTTMLEKAARAAEAVADYDGADHHTDYPGTDRVANWPAVMRAALQAIREPSPEMAEAVVATLDEFQTWDPDHWTIQIDAILEGKA